jgi:hypothetical protein
MIRDREVYQIYEKLANVLATELNSITPRMSFDETFLILNKLKNDLEVQQIEQVFYRAITSKIDEMETPTDKPTTKGYDQYK